MVATGGTLVASGTNNSGPGGTYQVMVSTNLQFPLSSWTVLTNGNFDSNGNFMFTNLISNTNAKLFYTLRVP